MNAFYLRELLKSNNMNEITAYLETSAKVGPPREDGTPVNRWVTTKLKWDVYATTGVGKTENVGIYRIHFEIPEVSFDCKINLTL